MRLEVGWRKLTLLYIATILVIVSLTPTIHYAVGQGLGGPARLETNIGVQIITGIQHPTLILKHSYSKNMSIDDRTVTLDYYGVVVAAGKHRVYGLLVERKDVATETPLVVAIPGPGYNPLKLTIYAERLAAKGFRVLLIYPPGYGGTPLEAHTSIAEALADNNPSTNYLAQLYRAAIESIVAAENLSRHVIVVGFGLGGSAALVASCRSVKTTTIVLFDGGGCIECSLRDGSLRLATMGVRDTGSLRLLDPLRLMGNCRPGVAVIVGLLRDWTISPRSISETFKALRASGWRVLVSFVNSLAPDTVSSYVVAAWLATVKPNLWPPTPCCSLSHTPPLAIPVGDTVAWRPLLPGLEFTASTPPQPVLLLYPAQFIVYMDSWFTRISTPVETVGFIEGIVASIVAAILIYLALKGLELGALGYAAVGLAIAAPSIVYGIPSVYWPGVGLLYLPSIVGGPLLVAALLASLASPIIVPLSLTVVDTFRKARVMAVAYAVTALLGFEASRVMALNVIGAGLPPFTQQLVAPLDAIPVIAAVLLYRGLLKPRVKEIMERMRARRRRIRRWV